MTAPQTRIFNTSLPRKNYSSRLSRSLRQETPRKPYFPILRARNTSVTLFKFTLICTLVSPFLLFTYRYFVRYTWPGTLEHLRIQTRQPLGPTNRPPARRIVQMNLENFLRRKGVRDLEDTRPLTDRTRIPRRKAVRTFDTGTIRDKHILPLGQPIQRTQERRKENLVPRPPYDRTSVNCIEASSMRYSTARLKLSLARRRGAKGRARKVPLSNIKIVSCGVLLAACSCA